MRVLLLFSMLFATLLIALKVGLSLMAMDAVVVNQGLIRAQAVVDSVSGASWEFGRPLLQLVVVLVLGEWFVSRLGLKVSSLGLGQINIQTFIAVAVVITFCLASLASLPGVSNMKDVVLIVIGFYFGTRSRQQSDQDVIDQKADGTKQILAKPGS
jgi:hypothetical protein